MRVMSRVLPALVALLLVCCGSPPEADTGPGSITVATQASSTERAAATDISTVSSIAPTKVRTPSPVIATEVAPERATTSQAAVKPTKVPKPTEAVRACPRHEVLANGYNGAEFGSKGIMANGKRVHWGAVAVDPEYIPLGTRMYISGFGKKVFVASDTGGAVKGWEIDIWFPSVKRAQGFTDQRRMVTIIGGPKDNGRRCE